MEGVRRLAVPGRPACTAGHTEGEGVTVPSILRPKALRPGDAVAVAALSGGLDDDEAPLFERGVEAIERMGFAVRVSPLVDRDRRWWWAAATPREVAEEFNRLLRDPEVRAVFALTGGRMAFSYLDLIEYDAARADPKPLLGFSDISALHLALHSRTGLVTVHADLVTHGFGYWHESNETRRKEMEDVYLRVLTGDGAPGALSSGRPWECWRSGRTRGPLIGGLLNRLVKVQATPFALDPDRFDGALLFWEEVGTSTAVVWNDLHALRSAGVFDRIAGMVVGTPVEVETSDGGPDTLREVVLDVLGERDIPVLGNVDIGHDPPNLPMPLGIRAELDADAVTLSLLEPAVTR
jgi:muramoyltetrapeptide carboxypeptidase